MRTLTEAERTLLAHVSMWGSLGYPVRKLGPGKWIWEANGVSGPPKAFATKREAVAHFETFLGVLREALGQEAKARALADLRARGVSEEEIRAMVERAEESERAKNS